MRDQRAADRAVIGPAYNHAWTTTGVGVRANTLLATARNLTGESSICSVKSR